MDQKIQLFEELSLDQDPGSNIKAPYGNFKTSVDKVFAAGNVLDGSPQLYGRLMNTEQVAREAIPLMEVRPNFNRFSLAINI